VAPDPPAIYDVQDLGGLGGQSTGVGMINDQGDVVGSSETAGGETHPYVWRKGVMTDLMPGGGRGIANAIDDRGDVVGQADIGSATLRAVLWKDGAETDLGTLGDDAHGHAYYIDGRGEIVVFSYNPSPERWFLWRDGVQRELVDFRPYAINHHGQIAGVSHGHAAIWRDGEVVDLGTLGGEFAFSLAIGISDGGVAVGTCNTFNGVQSHACLFEHGEAIDLDSPGGHSAGFGLNDRHQVVGSLLTASGERHAFLWSNGVMRDLGTLGGAMSVAYWVNERGQVVGTSTTASGDTHIFLWEDGAMKDLWTWALGPSTGDKDVVHINSRGEVAASCVAGNGERHGCIYRLVTSQQ
jgi:probable HAF family extracellular repeat protein